MNKTRIHKLKPRVSVTAETSPYNIASWNKQYITIKMERDTKNDSWTVEARDIYYGKSLSYSAFLPFKWAQEQVAMLAAKYMLDD